MRKLNYYKPNYNNLEQYVVKQNDSLYMIAKKYGITVDELMNTNHLVSTMIYPNQILFIPKKSTYVTKSNDNIQGIIDKYNLTLKDISGLKVMPNQDIPIRDNCQYYTVKMGDTIEDILSRTQLSPLELLKLNEGKLLVPGEKLIIRK